MKAKMVFEIDPQLREVFKAHCDTALPGISMMQVLNYAIASIVGMSRAEFVKFHANGMRAAQEIFQELHDGTDWPAAFSEVEAARRRGLIPHDYQHNPHNDRMIAFALRQREKGTIKDDETLVRQIVGVAYKRVFSAEDNAAMIDIGAKREAALKELLSKLE